MQLVKGFGLVILAVVVIALCTVVIVITSKPTMAVITVKALPQTRIAGYLMPVKEAAAVSVNYSQFTVKQLKAMARGAGIKSWGKLRKAELVAALTAI